MTGESDRLTLLQRLDLALAERASQRTDSQTWPDDCTPPWLHADPEADATCIAALLRLRDIEVEAADVGAVLMGRNGRFEPGGQELCLMRGLVPVLAEIRERAAVGKEPDGHFLWKSFRTMTDGVRRFRNNTVRVDLPWDGVARVPYPPPEAVPKLLEDFGPAGCYGEAQRTFESLHPVRQAFRVLWRFARIAPFPDFNLVVGFLAMDAHLLAKGYPMVVPEPGDRDLVVRLVAAKPPARVVRFEARLAELADCP